MPRCVTRISLALVLLLSSEVWALGLGEVRLESSLNEPLRAEIELLAASAEELQNLQVSLASPETFDRYGLERPYYLQDLVFEVVRSGRSDGNYVRVRSQTPMTEPFLTFLVEAVWANGRLLREYTVLLDPPTFAPPTSTPAQPQVAAPERAEPADSGRIERRPQPETSPPARTAAPAPARPPVTSDTEAPPEQAAAADDEAGTFETTSGDDIAVVRGDTLWGIATRIRPDSRLTMNQTMLAIFAANPEAFGGNINILRAGTRLRIPSADEIYRIDRGDAFNEARRQNEAWSGGVAVTPAPLPSPEVESRPSLTLVPPDDEPVAPDTSVTGETAAEPGDEVPGREQEILERIAELEAADVPAQQSLIEIRNNELANLRQELANIRGELYEPPTEEPAGPFVDDEAAEPPAEELFPEFDEEAVDEEAAAEEPAAEPAVADNTTTIARREPDSSLVDTLTGLLTNLWVWLGIVLLIVIGILVWFMRRGGEDEPDAWGGRLEPGAAPDETLAATESLRAPGRHDESIVVVEQTGRFRRPEPDTIEAPRPALDEGTADQTGRFGALEDTFSSDTAVNLDQSDPIAEADFHMAYGLYDQAADLINGALQAEPEREDLLTKLCEIYFVWGNREAFVAAAERLHAATGGASNDWDKIVIMGQQIAPDHEMFAGVAGATRAVDLSFEDEDTRSTGALDMDFGADGMGGGDEVIDLGGDGDGDDEDDGLDFIFDNDTATHRRADMTAAEPTVETPTISNRVRSNTPASDATAEIDLDDLGLDIDGLDDTEFADLDDDDATELASLDALDETGRNEAVDRSAATGRHARATPVVDTIIDDFDLDDDEFSSTRTGMRLAPDETGVNPALSSAEETGGDIDVDLLAATGRTQVLSDDFAVGSYADDDLNIGDNDKTMLAGRLGEPDFDFAKTEALPPGTYPGDTAERPALGSTDVDLDLDDLTQTLRQSVKGDTVEQRRDDATVEHRRPYLEDEESGETLSFAPDELSDDLDEARTMTEVGTKLDLARAYVDMGDPAGARSILEEVLDEGDSSQRQQAKKLLDSLPS